MLRERQTASARRTTSRAIALGGSGLLIALALPATAATAAPGHPGPGDSGWGEACEDRDNKTYAKLLECVTLDGVLEHQRNLQKIADNSTDPVYPGTRAAGTTGYDASADYVAGLLREAGYEVTLDPVDVTFNFPAVLRQLTPV
ncbi:MAG TPA: hypothetical protein VJ352_08735, partial [Geodermatophilus sp.]|nr:hypothetical protein [Geodermatophilus sp.]